VRRLPGSRTPDRSGDDRLRGARTPPGRGDARPTGRGGGAVRHHAGPGGRIRPARRRFADRQDSGPGPPGARGGPRRVPLEGRVVARGRSAARSRAARRPRRVGRHGGRRARRAGGGRDPVRIALSVDRSRRAWAPRRRVRRRDRRLRADRPDRRRGRRPRRRGRVRRPPPAGGPRAPGRGRRWKRRRPRHRPAHGRLGDGRTREVLSAAARDFALVGSPETVRERVDALREAGVDHVVGYPPAGSTSSCCSGRPRRAHPRRFKTYP